MSTGSNDPGQELLHLLNDPFKQQLNDGAIWSALGVSIGFTAFIAIAFSLLRPYNTVVYAPKLKHADEKHAPPPIGKGYFAWVAPLWKTTEKDMIVHAGMDAAIFMRFTRMCRDMFLVLAVLYCAILIPINYTNSNNTFNQDQDIVNQQKWLMRITPSNVWGQPEWGLIVVAYLSNLIICGFLWWNYRKVVQLRRAYFESEEYQQSLHARTLMLNDLPRSYASDEGISRIIDGAFPTSSFARTAVARNVKILPELIQQHDRTVRKLEKVLAIYLKDPHNLPAARPTCYPSKNDPSYNTYPRGQKIDAIEYLTQRIRELEVEVAEVRKSVDTRNTLPYGFASYDDISEAHSIAFALRNKKPQGATIRLAPRPNDIIWDNMPLSPATRRWRKFLKNVWVALLTVLWIAPNAMIAVFLVNLTNLGLVWKGFQDNLNANTGFWSVVQGVASPAITSLFYLVLPVIFRRLAIQAGDRTKTGRERHVVANLYGFFVFNNLIIFSIFSTLWSFISSVINDSKTIGAGNAILNSRLGEVLFVSLCNISPFWINWLLQRNLGAAIDLAQLWTLTYSSLMRKFSHPTPREIIELTAPPPFDYASYYNYFLFYATVALCYAPVQPLVLPAAALYFAIDVWLKKYMLLYIFVTKTESGGQFWRVLFNRLIFATILANLIVFLAAWIRGDGTHIQAYVCVPPPFLMIAFKIYCAKTFDSKISYYATRPVQKHAEDGPGRDRLLDNRRLVSRFGHPALWKPLITPMVHAKAQNILASVYRGRLTDGREVYSGDAVSTSGYSDAYVLDNMASGKAGKAQAVPGFEIVPEGKMDFEYFKNRPEFAAEHGGEGEMYGRAPDLIRPGTPSTAWGGSDGGSRPSSPGLPTVPRVGSPAMGRASPTYRAYSPTPAAPSAAQDHPYSASRDAATSKAPMYSHGNDSGQNLVSNAAAMSTASGGPQGYGNLPQEDVNTPEHDPMAYDYFRSSRTARR